MGSARPGGMGAAAAVALTMLPAVAAGQSAGTMDLGPRRVPVPAAAAPTARVAAPAPTPSTAAHADWLVRFAGGKVPPALAEALDTLADRFGVDARRHAVRLAGTVRLELDRALSADQLRPLLAAAGQVAGLEPNRAWHPAVQPNDPQFDRQWGLQNLGRTLDAPPDLADQEAGEDETGPDARDTGTAGIDVDAAAAWDRTQGDRDLRVAVIDTGVDFDHPDLSGQLYSNGSEIADNGSDDDGNGWPDDTLGWDACDDDGVPQDLIGHGTQVAGVIGARGDDGFGVAGVAWDVEIVPLRFLGPTPNANGSDCNLTSAAIETLDYALDVGVDVVNMSWGGVEPSDMLEQKLSELVDAGIVLIAASGNAGVDIDETPFYPASYDMPGLLAVAAHTNDGLRSAFSNFGSTVRLAAPGSSIFSDEASFEDVWDYANFSDSGEPNGPLDQGAISGTDFSIPAAGTHWGIASLSTGERLIIGDMQAAIDYDAESNPVVHGGGLNQVLVSDSFDAADWGQAVLRFEVFTELSEDSSLTLEYSVDGGAWQDVPNVSYSGRQAEQPSLDFEAVVGSLPDDLRIRFRLQTGSAHEGTLYGGVYLLNVEWIRPGSDYSEELAFTWTQGTSLAAPFAAGTAALIRALAPGLPPASVIDQMVLRSETLNEADSGIVGDRRLNAQLALSFEPVLVYTGAEGFTEDAVEPNTVAPGEEVAFEARLVDPEGEAGTDLDAALEIRPPDGGSDFYPLASSEGAVYGTALSFATTGTYGYRFAITGAEGEIPGGPAELATFNVALPAGSEGGGNGSTLDELNNRGGGGGCGCAVGGAGSPAEAAGSAAVAAGVLLWWRRGRARG